MGRVLEGTELIDDVDGRTRAPVEINNRPSEVFDVIANPDRVGIELSVTYESDIVDELDLVVVSRWFDTPAGVRWVVALANAGDGGMIWARPEEGLWLRPQEWIDLGISESVYDHQEAADAAAHALAVADLRPWLDWFRDCETYRGFDDFVERVGAELSVRQ